MTDPWGNPLPSQPSGPSQPSIPPVVPPQSSPQATPTTPPPLDPAWPGTPTPSTHPAPPAGAVEPAWPGRPPAPAAGPRTSGFAVTSLVLGIASITCAGFAGVVFAPLAVVFGLRARRTISLSNGWRTGDGLAVAGIVLGIIGIVISVVYLVFVLSNPDFLPDLLDRLTTTTTADGQGIDNA